MSEAEQRIRTYLAKFPDMVNLGPEIAYGNEFKSDSWPYAFYPLITDDLKKVLRELELLREQVDPTTC